MPERKQLVVLGGGPGGYAAAFLAADLGLTVAIVDDAPNPGGVCLYRGCIPSKSLLHVAKLIHETKQAKNWGITYKEPKINLNQLRNWKNSVISKMTSGLGMLTKQRKVTFIQGKGKFVGLNQLNVTTNTSNELIEFDHAIIATGSRPKIIPSLWLETDLMMDSTAALELSDVPNSLLVIGGGYIGLELGSVYSALGTKVTLVETLPNLLPNVDQDLSKILTDKVTDQFEDIYLNTKITSLKEEAETIKAELVTPQGKITESFSKVLLSVGRTPNTEDIGLESLNITTDDRGFIPVNEKRETLQQGIYAIGDVTGDPGLAHKATHEGRIAAESIAGHKVAFEPQAIPAVVFTDPEIAWCGLTESMAKAQNKKVEILRFPWAASGRATTIDRTEGMTKIVIDPSTERVLGMGIVGAGAGELIAEGVLAVEMAALATDIKLSIHPHPTVSETIMEAADMFFGQSTHLYRPQKK